LQEIGVAAGHHVLVHASYRTIRDEFPDLKIRELLKTLQTLISDSGSLIIPAFTYCFKRKEGNQELFDRKITPSKVGAVSEYFRNMHGVVRTASATHSFLLWGLVNEQIDHTNAPRSPLGSGSVLEWLAARENSYILMLGVDFTALSFGHYIEVQAPVPWYNYAPWDYLGVENVGVSVHGEQKLHQIPGCSKGFIRFEHYLQRENLTSSDKKCNYIPVSLLFKAGLKYFRDQPESLLCQPGNCQACDARRAFYLKNIKQRQVGMKS